MALGGPATHVRFWASAKEPKDMRVPSSLRRFCRPDCGQQPVRDELAAYSLR